MEAVGQLARLIEPARSLVDWTLPPHCRTLGLLWADHQEAGTSTAPKMDVLQIALGIVLWMVVLPRVPLCGLLCISLKHAKRRNGDITPHNNILFLL